ncbi:hypothetical protein BSR29_06725 [Boudabousia liubingyangii]|uniref:Nucleoside triphosphate pyrophosphatase n=1 Tax=Boudabousia liubingyangii TaxID=1921764 RepID=A0A1Q5PKZ2_9ACTO|nr:nucleoside triphosphate pyrophosphatase [Boudabousia liubingyangii]OKL46377.1 hypothetical protein BSR28_07555 [Boudabousia liubingyangii]OKL47300.1 hypothetical protein BSR29_06725 [Boudabousia liubingyangii]
MTHKKGTFSINLVLASASPARLNTLENAGIQPTVEISEVDEDALLAAATDLSPAETVTLLAQAKANEVAHRLQIADSSTPTAVIGADSMLFLDGVLQGKPHQPHKAEQRWQQQRGRSGTLYTGHALFFNQAALALGSSVPQADSALPTGFTPIEQIRTPKNALELTAAAFTGVEFGHISDSDLEAYIESKEPLKVAGAFTIDGLGGAFIDGLTGDPHSVVGISLPLLRMMTYAAGLQWHYFWAR